MSLSAHLHLPRCALAAVASATLGCQAETTAEPEPKPPMLAPAPLARLTATQYNLALRDLFAPLEVAPVALPQQVPVGIFDTDARRRTPTPTLVEAYQASAERLALAVVAEHATVTGCASASTACGSAYVRDLAARAFRRPLTAAEASELTAAFEGWVAVEGFDVALGRSIETVLGSPGFLYFPEFGTTESGGATLTPWEIAARLARLLWNSVPDAELARAAASGALSTPSDIEHQARRMLADPRARRAVVDFHRQWLALDAIGTNLLDLALYYPDADPDGAATFVHQQLQPTMRAELSLFVEQELFERSGTLRGLLTSTDTFANRELGALYDVEPDLAAARFSASFESFQTLDLTYRVTLRPVALDRTRRSGVLTSTGFLNSHAGPAQPSPVRRGVFIKERLLCQPSPPPPDDVPPLSETSVLTEPETNRDRYARHTRQADCAVCHESIDGIGFAFEAYDSLGRHRTEDNGHPVDSSGVLVGTDVDGTVANAVELCQRLAESRVVHDCYVSHWLTYASGRHGGQFDTATRRLVEDAFWSSGGDVRELVVSIATSDAFRRGPGGG